MFRTNKIGFGGSCHWCTEAIFQSLKGVIKVSQGWIEPGDHSGGFSEAVIVEFEPDMISIEKLIEIHLHTHSCTSQHSMRSKYRSAVYTFNDDQVIAAVRAIEMLQDEFENPIITKVIPFKAFKLNNQQYLDYYYNNPEKPLCKTFIDPKLKILLSQFSNHVEEKKLIL
ncbi:peptide-methionine (S)-S-oxide reductase [Dyadobacter chenwenxiniae]|uniref:peptide-methionine (S)-S-oxide reductase n=1 Tax=Dyadobacter chenwenxiniae TaxID=2906456 RepID=A0A9X1PSH3_9BACT|nr:peptide-methionine (S)-S-oxide reductase [Dyadobacter chenwenxiniae]MCF0065675.1 peptide-methionine (S)-S-oxide reductase [Dyadobacter chenwenxiniae]UON85583.1 peptide-methionine (S)-S-oxide reductase [Dyadobacter chenwenxiniae]